VEEEEQTIGVEAAEHEKPRKARVLVFVSFFSPIAASIFLLSLNAVA